MKIHLPSFKYILAGAAITGLTLSKTPSYANNLPGKQGKDVFEKKSVSPEGTQDIQILSSAPSPDVRVCGINKKAKIVVDLKTNTLYTYNEYGQAQSAYSIASGKASTPTHAGVRIVSHTETYPYRTAPSHTKRRRNPRAYGPKVIILDALDTKTGERSSIGEFIHGNNDSSSIGKYASKGCMRMDNEVIKQLSTSVKRGDIVIILGKN